jgi:hypothetical protein
MMRLEYWPAFVLVPVAVVFLAHVIFAAVTYMAYRRKGTA